MVGSVHTIPSILLSQHNDTCRDWRMQAVVCGEGFSGPKVVNVPAGTKVSYPLTFNPSTQHIIMVMHSVVVPLFLSFVFLYRMSVLLHHIVAM